MRHVILKGAFLCATVLTVQSVRGQVFSSLSVSGNDAAAFADSPPNGTQRENDAGGMVVPFGEEAFIATDRTHEYNGPRFTATGALTTAVASTGDDIVKPLPTYLVGNEYVSTQISNRDNASFAMTITVNRPVRAYLLIDNRVGDGAQADPPTLGSGGTGQMPWVADNGWLVVNTGFSPNGQPDFVGADEGATPANFAGRTHLATTGPGNGLNQFFTVYSHDFPAGSFQTFAQNDTTGATSREMYGVVLAPIPEPAGLGLLTVAGVLGLARRRRGTRPDGQHTA